MLSQHAIRQHTGRVTKPSELPT